MGNLHGTVVTPLFGLNFVRFYHVLSGIFLWEFFTSLDYEWKVYRGQLPRRWTIWVYTFSRVTCLSGIICNLVGLDATSPINCQAWMSFVSISFGLALGAASLLVSFRIIALWNGNKPVKVAILSLWAIGVGFHIQYAARLRAVWLPGVDVCVPVTTKHLTGVFGLLPTVFTDLTLIVIMLVGLIMLNRNGNSSFGLTPIILKQGVVWLLLGFLSEAPEAVIALMSTNAEFIELILTPGVIAMIIAATRMHRTLAGCAFGSRSTIGPNSLELGSIAYTRSKSAPPTPSRIEVTVHRAFEQELGSQKTDNDSTDGSNVQTVQEKPNISWSVRDDVERGEV